MPLPIPMIRLRGQLPTLIPRANPTSMDKSFQEELR